MKSGMLTVKQVAEWLNVSLSMVYRLVERGLIPSYKISGSIRFIEEELSSWIGQNKLQPAEIKSNIFEGKRVDFDEAFRRIFDSKSDS